MDSSFDNREYQKNILLSFGGTVKKISFLFVITFILLSFSCMSTQSLNPNMVVKNEYGYVCCIVNNTSEENLFVNITEKRIFGRKYRLENVIPGEKLFLLKLKEGEYFVQNIGLGPKFYPTSFSINVKSDVINFIGEIEISRIDMAYRFPQIPQKLYSYQIIDTFQVRQELLNVMLSEFLDKYKLENVTVETKRRIFPGYFIFEL